MRKIKEILKLKYDANLSYHQIARGVNVSTSTVHDIVSRFNQAALSWPLSAELKNESNLERKLYPGQVRTLFYDTVWMYNFSFTIRQAILMLTISLLRH